MVREKDQGPEEIGPPWTALKLLRWTADYFEAEDLSETPRLDADLLLAEVLDLDRVELYARFDTVVDDSDRAAFRELVKRRAAGEPVAYLIGRKSFWQMEFAVDDSTIIPRPETEVLVEEALEYLPADEPLTVVDIGTGTGAIALAVAKERPAYDLVATDDSEETLALARHNANRLGYDDQIDFHHGDLFEALPADRQPVDAVISNPPYVPEGDRDIGIEVRAHEPDHALFGGSDGLDILERLVEQSPEVVVEGGWLFVEIGAHQGDAVVERFEAAAYDEVAVRRDYGDHDRVVRGRTPGSRR